MASLYPTLEDMKVDQVLKAQETAMRQGPAAPVASPGAAEALPSDLAAVYPSLMQEYMGLRLEPPTGPLSPPYPTQDSALVPRATGVVAAGGGTRSSATAGMIAPLTGGNVGLQRAQVTHGVRQLTLCKDGKGKVGLRLRAIDKGVFVQFVAAGSAASLGGLRFGDQILQVDGANVAGFSGEKAMDLIRKANAQRFILAVRDRPFERTITLHKDSSGHVGFTYRGNKITAIAKDSSAARNGLLIDHFFLELNGQNVIQLKQKELETAFDNAGEIVTLTIMPAFVYEHMISHMSGGLMKKLMDHSVPDV